MHDLIQELERFQSNREMLNYLSENCIDLYYFVLNEKSMYLELNQNMEKCKLLESDWKKFTLYIRGYWLPHLKQ